MIVWISSMNRTAPGGIADLGDHSLQPLFEIAAVAGSRHQCSQVEREDASALQGLRRLALDDAQRQPLGDGGLADAGLADQHRVVLGPAAQDLDGARDRVVTADDRIDPPGRRSRIEVDAPGRQRAVGDWCCRFHRF
jgi:hypothetical protein